MPKDGLISSYFAQATPGIPKSGTVADKSRSASQSPSILGIRHERDDSNSGEDDRVSKQPRLESAATTKKVKEVIIANSAKLDQWRYDPGTSIPANALTQDGTNATDQTQALRTEEQEARHAAFTRRLLTSIERKEQQKEAKRLQESNEVAEASQDEEDEDVTLISDNLQEFAAPKTNGKSRAAKDSTVVNGIKYTPLEKQYLDLRQANPDVLLCIEVGYKFKFYGDDARVASRELNIACFMEKHLMTAMVPLHRLQLHIKKLVLAGHKVGVVRQTETRALKAASSNASKPFTRKMTELYTASTWVDDMLDSGQDGSNPASPRSLIAIVEKSEGGSSGAEERVSIGLIAIQTSTGTITYDQFTDTTMRSELETRLAHLEPAEMILPKSISKQTNRLLKYIAGQSSSTAAAVRIERTEDAPSYNEAYSSVGQFYAKGGFIQDDQSNKADVKEILSVVVALPSRALIALAVAIEHMSKFHLESVFRLATNFTSFASRHEMLLTGNTLSNLEILENNTDYRERGSLMWLLSGGSTTTMGKRMLRRWLTRPLINVQKLQERSDAVEALLNERHIAARVSSLLKGLPDVSHILPVFCKWSY